MEQRLIDACELKRDISKLPITSSWWEAFVKNLIDEQPIVDPETIIDPETLPIVQELREKLWRVTVERDAAVWQLHGKCYACKHNDTPFHSYGQCEECRYRYYQFEMANAFDNWTWSGTHQEE